jgi:hypothetical protein
LAIFHDSYARACGSQVNANGFAHLLFMLLKKRNFSSFLFKFLLKKLKALYVCQTLALLPCDMGVLSSGCWFVGLPQAFAHGFSSQGEIPTYL